MFFANTEWTTSSSVSCRCENRTIIKQNFVTRNSIIFPKFARASNEQTSFNRISNRIGFIFRKLGAVSMANVASFALCFGTAFPFTNNNNTGCALSGIGSWTFKENSADVVRCFDVFFLRFRQMHKLSIAENCTPLNSDSQEELWKDYMSKYVDRRTKNFPTFWTCSTRARAAILHNQS